MTRRAARTKSTFDWTPAAIDQLRALSDTDMAYSEIARRIGCTKNAAIGKSRRLGLDMRPSPIGNGGARAKKLAAAVCPPPVPVRIKRMPGGKPALPAPPKPAKPTPVLVEVFAVAEDEHRVFDPAFLPLSRNTRLPTSFATSHARHRCDWLSGDAPPYTQCTAEAVTRIAGVECKYPHSYCVEHRRVAYTKLRWWEREDAA